MLSAVALLLALGAPFVGLYPVFMMKVLCFALFACAFNLLLGYTGLLSFGHAAFFGGAGYVAGYAMQVAGACRPKLGLILRHALGGAARPGRRPARDPPPGHLLRDDHAGAGADGVLRLPAGAVHRRRGRPAGRAARQAVRHARPGQRPHAVLRRAGVSLPPSR